MRIILVVVTVIGLLMIPISADAVDILLLGDGGSEADVQPALEAAGHSVTFAGHYSSWDGANPSAADFDAVVFLNAIDYSQPLQANAVTALQDFVTSGGGLVTGEWTAYGVCQGYHGSEIADLMPVVMPACSSWGASATWIVDDPTHPLTDGVDPTWSDGAKWSTVEAKPDTVVVVSDDTSNPMVSFSKQTGGNVVHINHDMLFTTASMNPNAKQLIVNAADFAGSYLFACDFESGTTSAWAATIQ